jgi:hypothetical protein
VSCVVTSAGRFRRQAAICAEAGSPLYAALLEAAAAVLDQGGVTSAVMAGNEGRPGSVPSLRLMAALHRLVLDGRAPGLARHYPSVGGTPGTDAPAAMLAAMREHTAAVRELASRPVQTNEVGRVPLLLDGLREVARETGRRLRVLEIGASAGLNLALLDDPAIARRRGCDLDPIDPGTEQGRLTLESFVWADQVERLARLRAALAAAARRPVTVDRAHAPEWLAARLAEPAGGLPVVVHSVVLQYLDEAARRDVEQVPAWRVSFEQDELSVNGEFALAVIPPGGEPRVLARGDSHGGRVTRGG